MRVTLPDGTGQLKNVPRHVFTAALDADVRHWVALHVRYRDSRGAYLDNENRHAIDGSSTFDLRARRSLGDVVVFLDVLNLTGNRYQQYGFTLSDFRGREFRYSYPGSPRALRAGIIASF